MSYKFAIVHVASGETRTGTQPFEWKGERGDTFWWQEGNMACDCNRHLEWLRAGGPGPVDDPHHNNAERECGHGAYRIPYIELEDGRRIEIDAP